MSYDERREEAAGRPMHGPRGDRTDWGFWDEQEKTSRMIKIPVICSWCKKSLGVVEVEEATVAVLEEADARLTSDGVCDGCSAQLLEEVKKLKKGG